MTGSGPSKAQARSPGYTIPMLDISWEDKRRFVVDREARQYLGHVTSILLEDGQTIYAVYPKGHGRGPIVLKRSPDGGRTWSERLPTPKSWATSREVPTLYRTFGPSGQEYWLLFSGLYPIRMAYSQDQGNTWSALTPIGDYGGIVAMSDLVPLQMPGHYLAFFHDDGRMLRGGPYEHWGSPAGEADGGMRIYAVESFDGGLTWGEPRVIIEHPRGHLCEAGALRSPDGSEIAILLRENTRQFNSFASFSRDEGRTWSEPQELPAALTGDRHTARYLQDGRVVVVFRDTARHSASQGDWAAWVGTYEDIRSGREGSYRIRIHANHRGWDCAYPGVHVLPNGTVTTMTYGHWAPDAQPYVLAVQFHPQQLERRIGAIGRHSRRPGRS